MKERKKLPYFPNGMVHPAIGKSLYDIWRWGEIKYKLHILTQFSAYFLHYLHYYTQCHYLRM